MNAEHNTPINGLAHNKQESPQNNLTFENRNSRFVNLLFLLWMESFLTSLGLIFSPEKCVGSAN